MIRMIRTVAFALFLAVSGMGLYGCATTDVERPEAFTGQTEVTPTDRDDSRVGGATAAHPKFSNRP